MGLALPPFLMGAENTGIKGSSNNNNGQPSSSESEDWGDETWTVDCPCGVNFDDGDEMVECDECNVWVHTACCQVSKSIATYVCDKCKEKKRKEREESEVAQLLVELPGKTVSFDDQRSDMLQNSFASEPIERRAHEQGVPGGDSSIFVGSSVFSQQLWKSTGYVPKLLQVQYAEIPNWHCEAQTVGSSLFDFCKQPVKELLSKSLKKVKLEQQEKVLNVDAEAMQRSKASGEERHGKKVSKQQHKHKFRGLKDDKQQCQGKRVREEVKEQQYSRKKAKSNSDAGKVEKKTYSLKNPKAMKKSAVQEFMDVDTRVCSKCLRPEPVANDDQGSLSKPSICQECQKSRHGLPNSKKQENRIDMEGPPDQCKKYRTDNQNNDRTISQNLSPETASTELPKQSVEQRGQQLLECGEVEKKAQEGESVDQSFSHQSSRQQQQQKPSSMKPPDDVAKRSSADASVEQKGGLQGCQLTIKTSAFSKSEIPSPASINSRGPTKGVGGATVKSSPSSPTNQKSTLKSGHPAHLPPCAAAGKTVKSSSSKHVTGVPTFKKSSDVKSSNGTHPSNPATKSTTLQPSSSSKQLLPCKSSSLKTSQVVKKPVPTHKPGSGSKDAGDRTKDEKSSVLKTSPSGSAAAPLNDEELALLLHQELNSSPRVPRVPRVRQAAASVSAQPSNILSKRALGSVQAPLQKESRLMWRKRQRDDLKESSRGSSKYAETPHMNNKRHQEEGTRTDDEAASSRADSAEASEGVCPNDPGAVSSKKHASPSIEADEASEGGGGERTTSSEPGFVSPSCMPAVDRARPGEKR